MEPDVAPCRYRCRLAPRPRRRMTSATVHGISSTRCHHSSSSFRAHHIGPGWCTRPSWRRPASSPSASRCPGVAQARDEINFVEEPQRVESRLHDHRERGANTRTDPLPTSRTGCQRAGLRIGTNVSRGSQPRPRMGQAATLPGQNNTAPGRCSTRVEMQLKWHATQVTEARSGFGNMMCGAGERPRK